MIDIDASLIEVHSENKEGAAPHYKGGFGFHPMYAFADCTGECLAVLLRPGNAAALPLSVSFHVMDLADGALSELLPLRHEVGWGDKLRIFRDVVSGIHQMHGQRIVHRDLEASNVLLFDTATRTPVAKVSDLGRSRDLTQPPRFAVDSYAAGRGDRSHAPPEIRQLVVDLVRQMCNPVPARRESRFSAERNNRAWGLQWAIRRVVIIIKNLEMNRARKATARKGRRV